MSFLPSARLACALACLAPPSALAAAHKHHLDHSGKPQSGVASYYRPTASERRTASGTRPTPGKLTAASRTLPLGTRAKVVNRKTGKSVNVTVTDRGPYARHRVLDVSPKAAQHLGMTHDGVAPVKVQPLQEPAKGGTEKRR
ncbi:MAG: rare lipoprotein [Phenylobacterium sp.]|nr:rare lipoprotein [Phenylobacterium sp.]